MQEQNQISSVNTNSTVQSPPSVPFVQTKKASGKTIPIAIFTFLLLLMTILGFLFFTNKSDEPEMTTLTPTVGVTQTTEPEDETSDITPAVEDADNWNEYSSNDFGITFKYPKAYTIKLAKNSIAKSECDKINSDIAYNDIQIYNESRLILSTFVNILGGNPMDCELVGTDSNPPDDTKSCLTIFSKTDASKTYTLLADPNYKNPNYQFFSQKFNPGNLATLYTPITKCSTGSSFKMSNYDSDTLLFNSYTEEEFNNIVDIIESIKQI